MQKTIAIVAVALLTGCGGGGANAPGAPGGNAGAQPAPKLQQATLKISFPVGSTTAATQRKPDFVSPNANSLKITVDTVNGGAPPSYVTPNPFVAPLTTAGGTPNCTISGGMETCTVTNVPAPPGTVNYTFAVYASTDGSGTALSTATVNETVVQGIANTFSVTLSGVASTIVTTVPTKNLTANSPLTQTDIVQVQDPSGARIVGTAPFSGGTTVTVTNNDTSGQTALQAGTAGGSATTCAGNACTLSHGADTVNLVYTGRAAAPSPTDAFTIVASATGLTTQTVNASITDLPITFDVTTLDDTAHGGQAGDPNYNQLTLFFATTGQTSTFNAAELGWSNAPYSQPLTTAFDSASCGSGAAAVATITPSTGTSFTATSKNVGICKLTVSDGVGQSKVLYLSVTTAAFNVNSKNRQ